MKSDLITAVFEKGKGIFRMIPVFIPRRFSTAGRRLRLHPDDYFALGTARGSIKERWFSSTIPAMNGPLAPADEGMSYVAADPVRPDRKFLFKEACDELGAELIGEELYSKYGTWPMYSKFFDFGAPLFHHLHLDFQSAGRVGRLGKPEAYFFPPQLNNHLGTFPHTYFGWAPETTKDDVRKRLMDYQKRDIRITELSRAYRIELGTGWYTPPGVIHAPGSVLTYEPQWNSDVNSVYENITEGEEIYSEDFLNENCPQDKKKDIDYIISLMDWEKNVAPDYKARFFRPPVLHRGNDAYVENWIVYGNPYLGAKELTIFPGCSATLKDPVAYGCILIQGFGTFGGFDAESATMLRFGQMSADEYFVSEQAAKDGVKITNKSRFEPLVILKHFGPNYPEMP